MSAACPSAGGPSETMALSRKCRGLIRWLTLVPVELWKLTASLAICFCAGDRAEGAENKMSDKANNNRVLSSTSAGGGRSRSQSSTSLEGQALETRMKQLSLQCSKGREGIIADIKTVQIG